MVIQIFSDLHFEFEKDSGWGFVNTFPAVGEVLVLAGDVFPLTQWTSFKDPFKEMCRKFYDVVYVPGNHEFYHDTIANSLKVLDTIESEVPNIHILRCGEQVFVNKKEFIGGTLWFPNLPDNILYQRQLNDFHKIYGGFQTWVYEQNRKCSEALREKVNKDSTVVTHTLPHPLCVAEQYKNDPLNRFFVSSETATIGNNKPGLWIHGHTHSSVNIMVGGTRIICNPAGYNRENKDFKPDLYVSY